jgi:ketosteroid isomerase-like protein
VNNFQQVAPQRKYQKKYFLIYFSLIILIFCQSVNIFAQDSPEKSLTQEQAIEKVLKDQVEAWNKGSLEGFMAGYWQSADLSFYSNKSITHGWQQTLDRYKSRYQSEGREMGKLTFKDLEIEMLGTDNAFVRGKWQLDLKTETVGGLFTLIFKKFPDGWRVIHDHTSG